MNLERREFGLIDVKLRGDGGDAGTFSGYGAIFGNVDSYGDVIERGAFKGTLSEWQTKGKWPKMLLQHGGWGIGSDDMLPVGQWTSMSEDSKGLKVEGRLFAMNTERGQYVYEGLKSGELDSLSIGFQTVSARDEVEDGEVRRHLTEINLWEVSIVTFPANDRAKISTVKGDIRTIRDFESFLREVGGFSHARAKAIASHGFKATEPRDEDVPDTAAASAAAEAVAARFAAACLKF